MTDVTMLAVVAELEKRGVKASYEYPGFIAVEVPPMGLTLNFGDTSDLFGCSVDHEGAPTGEYIESSIPSDSTDVADLTDFICCTYTDACGRAPEYQLPEEPEERTTMKSKKMSLVLTVMSGMVLLIYGSAIAYYHTAMSEQFAEADWDAIKLAMKIGGPLLYVLQALLTGRSLSYYLSILFAKIEAHQRLIVALVAQSYKQYGEDHRAYESRVRQEIGAVDQAI